MLLNSLVKRFSLKSNLSPTGVVWFFCMILGLVLLVFFAFFPFFLSSFFLFWFTKRNVIGRVCGWVGIPKGTLCPRASNTCNVNSESARARSE